MARDGRWRMFLSAGFLPGAGVLLRLGLGAPIRVRPANMPGPSPPAATFCRTGSSPAPQAGKPVPIFHRLGPGRSACTAALSAATAEICPPPPARPTSASRSWNWERGQGVEFHAEVEPWGGHAFEHVRTGERRGGRHAAPCCGRSAVPGGPRAVAVLNAGARPAVALGVGRYGSRLSIGLPPATPMPGAGRTVPWPCRGS